MKSKLFVAMLLIGFGIQGYAQNLQRLSFAATTEAIGLPFTNYFPIHPGFEVEATFKRTEKTKSIRSLNATLGFFHHRKLETAVYLGGEYQYTYKLFQDRLGIDLPAGLGYLHSFYPSELYEQTETGAFESISQIGRAHLYFNVGIGLSYLGNEKIQPFIRQELMLETFFANGLPIIPHSFLKIGININISKA